MFVKNVGRFLLFYVDSDAAFGDGIRDEEQVSDADPLFSIRCKSDAVAGRKLRDVRNGLREYNIRRTEKLNSVRERLDELSAELDALDEP